MSNNKSIFAIQSTNYYVSSCIITKLTYVKMHICIKEASRTLCKKNKRMYMYRVGTLEIYIQGDPLIVLKFWMSNSLLKTKQEIILTKCCDDDSFQTIKHCDWVIDISHF